MSLWRCLLGLAVFCLLAWLWSEHKRRVPWRLVIAGIAMQFALGWIVLCSSLGQRVFEGAAAFIGKVIDMAVPGAAMVFGPLGDSSSELGFVFAFAGKGLIAIIFFSALMSILYHLGVMQVVVWCVARVMSLFLRVSGAESMAVAANIFVGQTEAPLVVKPYIARMTRSELNAMMVGGFATIAGSVMAVYMGLLGPEIAPHLLSASVMSAPAALVIAKILLPETEQAATAGKVELRIERDAGNLLEAATNGTTDGLKLWLNVIAMLIAFTALMNLLDWPLGWLGDRLALADGLSLGRIFGWVLAPVAWIMGIQSWHDCQIVGSLLGIKTALNEFVAYQQLAQIKDQLDDPRSAVMAAYGLCGFANFASIGIQIGGITPLAPERKRDLAQLALRAMVGGSIAAWMTATVAGVFL